MVFYTFIISSNISFLSADKLEHENNEHNFGVNFSILSFNDPPEFFLINIEKLLH